MQSSFKLRAIGCLRTACTTLLLASIMAGPLRCTCTASAQSMPAPGVRLQTLPRMVNPAIDETGEPFSYASRSTDQLSVMHAPSGAEITPEGGLYTGFGELDLYVGVDRAPVQQRIRTLKNGYLPVISYTVEHDGLHYLFSYFAASVGPSPNPAETGDEIIVNFVRVTVLNPNVLALPGRADHHLRHRRRPVCPTDPRRARGCLPPTR
jgi:hypothetical protein